MAKSRTFIFCLTQITENGNIFLNKKEKRCKNMDNLSAKLSGIFEFVSSILNYIYDFVKSFIKKDTVEE